MNTQKNWKTLLTNQGIRKCLIPFLVSLIFLFMNSSLNRLYPFVPLQGIRVLFYLLGMGIFFFLSYGVSWSLKIFFWPHYEAQKGVKFPNVVKTVVHILIYLLGLMGIVGIVFDQSITGIWALLTMVGGVIGFALKEIIADFFTGLALNLDKGLRVGEHVRVRDESGAVVSGYIQEITWRTTHISQKDGAILIIPNGLMASSPVGNLTRWSPASQSPALDASSSATALSSSPEAPSSKKPPPPPSSGRL